MSAGLTERFKVGVRLLNEPCLWCWEIRDAADGDLVESSWTAEWIGYDSREEALAEGLVRLAGLASRGPAQVTNPSAAGRHPPPGGAPDDVRGKPSPGGATGALARS